MKKLLCALGAMIMLGGCATELAGEKADLTTVSFPAGMTVHPNGKIAYVVGSNFDLDYRSSDGGALYVVDLENNAILESSKRIGSFGTNVVLTEDAKRGYLVTRNDDALVWFEISDDGRTISCPKDRDADNLMKCRVIIDDHPTHVSVTRSYRETKVRDDNGNETTKRVDFDLLMIAQLSKNSFVTAMTVVTPEDSGDEDYRFSYETASLVYSASETLWLKGEQFFVTGRAASDLALIEPIMDADAKVLGLHVSTRLTVPQAYSAYKGRGMVMDPARRRLYLVNQYPNSVVRFNVGSLIGGDAANEMAQATAVGVLPEDMSKIVWVGNQTNGRLYLSSVTDDSIYIVDPESLEILNKVSVGRGPYDLWTDADTGRLLVLHFFENDIWEFDTSDPDAPVMVKKYLASEDNDDESSEASAQE
ncbi:MAG: hypothetical protein IIY06_10300 [Proteobacteria bacterium]|nr:hypothetical protein [Pseudomonadota bacterium]